MKTLIEKDQGQVTNNIRCNKKTLKKKKKKLHGSFLWMRFNCLIATEPLQGGSLLFYHKVPKKT